MAGTVTASVIKNDTTSPPQFQNSAGTQIGTLCRAWVAFNGTSAAIAGSFNVSSVVRNSQGNYTVNFTTSMPDTNYGPQICIGSTAQSAPNAMEYITGSKATGSCVVVHALDRVEVSVAIFR